MFGLGSLFGKIFATDAAVKSVVDNVASGLDALVYTDEEEAKDAAAARTEARKMIIDWMRSTQGQNLARRIIALAITGIWLLQYMFAWCMDMAAVFVASADVRLALTQASTATDGRAESMTPAVMLILAFYFAAPHMGDMVSAAIGKMKDRIG